VRTALILFDPPCLDETPRLDQRLEPMDVQAFVAQRTVERPDERVVGRLAGPRKVDPLAVVIGPQIHEMPGELGTVVSKKNFRR
jgi:hypothetical protein